MCGLGLLGGVIVYHAGIEMARQREVQYDETGQNTTFTTKHGETTFTREDDAAWKEAMFYREAVNGNMNDRQYFDAFVRTSPADNVLTQKESNAARDKAKATYLKRNR